VLYYTFTKGRRVPANKRALTLRTSVTASHVTCLLFILFVYLALLQSINQDVNSG